MAAGDKICYNGEITTLDHAGLRPLTGTNYIYQSIHTTGHSALHAEAHLEIAATAMKEIDNCNIGLDATTLRRDIRALLSTNHYPNGSNLVTLRLFPDAADATGCSYMLDVTSQMLYPEYTLSHTRTEVMRFPCEYIYMGYPTAVSLLAAAQSRATAERFGAEAAIIENCNGVLTNVGDEPVFMVFGQEVWTSSLTEGATDSVMRRLIFMACAEERLNIAERPLTYDMTLKCDELFYPTPQGIVAAKGHNGRLYFNIIAGRIAGILNRLELP